VWQGVGIVQFSTAKSKSVPLEPWSAVPGLAFAVQEATLTSVDDSSDDKAFQVRRDELAQILAIRPLSSYYWLQFAEARIETHEDLAKVVDALELSVITGPNEDYVMMQRGMFGVWVWERLPSEERDRTAADLAASRISDEKKVAWLWETLSEKTEQVRQEIRAALKAHGFADGKLERIGL
jgi:hypothetical protein